jgi:hypothetical protein
MLRRSATIDDPKPTAPRIQPLAARVRTGSTVLPDFQRPTTSIDHLQAPYRPAAC